MLVPRSGLRPRKQYLQCHCLHDVSSPPETFEKILFNAYGTKFMLCILFAQPIATLGEF